VGLLKSTARPTGNLRNKTSETSGQLASASKASAFGIFFYSFLLRPNPDIQSFSNEKDVCRLFLLICPIIADNPSHSRPLVRIADQSVKKTGLCLMKIAYLCDISPEHTQPYSGGNARIYRALQDHVGEVDILPQSWGAAEPVRRAIYALPDGINLRLRWRLHLLLSQIISRSVTQALAATKYDVVFGAYSFQSMARLKTPYPMLKAFTADASFTVYKQSEIGASFGSSWLSRRLLDPLTFRAERAIYQNLDLALWPSDWLKGEADALYNLSESQSVVVPWGANIDTPKAEATPLALSKDAQVNLLVVGRDWLAKGGPVAFETMNILREAGVDARLTVVGTQPPDVHINPYVKVHRALNKAVPRERALFEAAFRNAHFLVQPSFESWGFAFCEAAAYSLPSLCLSVGGVPVQDGITGHDLPQGSSATEFAKIIQGYLKNPASYAALRLSSRAEFEASLNWDAWGRRVHDLFEERLASGMLSDMPSRT